MRMDDFAAQYLFSPLGITEYEWDFINPDVVHASGNLKLRPRDMTKFGYLILNDGVWQGERILSQAWVDKKGSLHFVCCPRPWGAIWLPVVAENLSLWLRNGGGTPPFRVGRTGDLLVLKFGHGGRVYRRELCRRDT